MKIPPGRVWNEELMKVYNQRIEKRKRELAKLNERQAVIENELRTLSLLATKLKNCYGTGHKVYIPWPICQQHSDANKMYDQGGVVTDVRFVDGRILYTLSALDGDIILNDIEQEGLCSK